MKLDELIKELTRKAYNIMCVEPIFQDCIRELEELQKYKAIGRVEECKEAADKQKAIKPNLWGDGYYNGELIIDMYDCPNCEKSYELECEEYDYCPNCGQKLDWRE